MNLNSDITKPPVFDVLASCLSINCSVKANYMIMSNSVIDYYKDFTSGLMYRILG